MKPRKHAELIKAWADGAEIERREICCHFEHNKDVDVVKEMWVHERSPLWIWNAEYRIKPESKPDVVLYANASRCKPHLNKGFYADISFAYDSLPTENNPANLKLTFDGETGELKSAEVLK